MLEVQEREDVTPLCPHCEAPLQTIFYRGIRALLGRRFVYFCSSCRKVLGVSHRKGFWMG